jgi:hypothetical protein
MHMISPHHNYDQGYIGLVNLELSNLPQTLQVKGYELLRKSEFHISLVCAKRIALLIDKTKAEQIETGIVTLFKDFIRSTPLTKYAIKNEYRLVKRDKRVALVVMVDVPGIEQLFAKLQERYNTTLPLQPTHITLYTLQPEAGIGILSEKQLRQDSEAVDIDLPLVRTQIRPTKDGNENN